MAARVSQRTIRRGLRDHVRPLGHYKIGRRVVIPARDLMSWLESHRAPVTIPAPAILAKVSPPARELLDGLLGTPAAPTVRKLATVQGRAADSQNDDHLQLPHDAQGADEKTPKGWR
jgi:hypothetical protein